MIGTRCKVCFFGLLILGCAGAEAWLPSEGTQAQAQTAEIEALQKEIDALRAKVEALAKRQARPQPHALVASRPLTTDVVDTQNFVATIRAHRHINVSPLASGYLEEMAVKEGQEVKKGDILFKILPTLYQLRLESERAEVQAAQIELQSINKLFEKKTISEHEAGLARTKLAKAQAQAKLAEAELNFTEVRAPFDGIVGRLQLQPGSLAREGDILTTLSDNRLVYVYFNVPEVNYLEYMARFGKGGQGQEPPQIELVLANGSKVNQVGHIALIESDFHTDTGTIAFRADFPNPDHLLRHGQVGTVLLHQLVKNALVIPRRATLESDSGRYVYVIDQNNVLQRRDIVIAGEMDGVFAIKEGLEPSDKILVEGIRQVRPGDKVEFEFRPPEELLGHLKKQLKK
jgi:membrane fusion protein (multidrug efflux system)